MSLYVHNTVTRSTNRQLVKVVKYVHFMLIHGYFVPDSSDSSLTVRKFV